MKKLNEKEKEEFIQKLRLFWKKYQDLSDEHFKKLIILEREMNKKVKAKINLEFFYVDGECVGIGAENYSDREWFPLIQDREFENKD